MSQGDSYETGWQQQEDQTWLPPRSATQTLDVRSTANAVLPVGMISAFWGTTAPVGWLLCDGATFSAGTYPALAALLGGTTTPNLKGKVIVGYNAAETEFDTLGETGGSKTSTAPHDHSLSSHSHTLEAHDHSLSDHRHALEQHNHDADHFHLANLANLNWTNNSVHTHSGHPGYATEGAEPNNGIPVAVPVNVDSYTGDTGGWVSPAGWTSPNTNVSGAVQNKGGAGGPSNNTSGASSVAAASGNLQPYMALNYIIKAA